MIKLKDLLGEKFASKAQQRYMFANEPEAAKKLASKMTTKDYENLPDKVDEDNIDEDLKKWFSRNRGKGWIDCNTCKRSKKTGRRIKCKACAGKGRKKSPDCRKSPAACDDPGRGTKWGKSK